MKDFFYALALAMALSGCSGGFSTDSATFPEKSKIDAGPEGFSTGGDIGTGGNSAGGTTNSGGIPVSSGGTQPFDAGSALPEATPLDGGAPPEAAPCAGCLDAMGVCHEGTERSFCGSVGGACEDCAASDFLDTMSHSALYCAPGFLAAFTRTCEAGGVCKKNSLNCCTKLGHCA